MDAAVERSHFCRFPASRCFVLRGRRGTSRHSDVFLNVSKVFCVAGAILSRRFQKMHCSFRGRRNTLETSVVMSRGRRSTSDVSCCVFFANRIVGAASGKFRGRRMKIDGSLARNIDFEAKKNWASWINSYRKTSILELQTMKIWGGLARNARFEAPLT